MSTKQALLAIRGRTQNPKLGKIVFWGAVVTGGLLIGRSFLLEEKRTNCRTSWIKNDALTQKASDQAHRTMQQLINKQRRLRFMSPPTLAAMTFSKMWDQEPFVLVEGCESALKEEVRTLAMPQLVQIARTYSAFKLP